jgi:predicted secreted protein
MSTQGAIGYGVLIYRESANSPSVFSDLIGEIKEVGGPDLKRDTVDATHSQSSQRYREFLSGLRDGGEVTCTLALVPGASLAGQQAKLVADFENDSLVNYQIKFPNTAKTYWQASMFLTALPHAMPIDGEMTHALTFKVSGRPTLADGWV